MIQTVNLNHGSNYFPGRVAPTGPTTSDIVNGYIDRALLAEREQEGERDYLGASRIGEECARKLAYEYLHAPAEPFTGKQLRIFDAGHVFEDLQVKWLKSAGFDIRVQNARGYQFGFEAMGGRIKGHIDGVLLDGPNLGQPYPGGWEAKALNDRNWNDTVKKGVKDSKPVYYGQMQIYMAYMDMQWFLFSAMNKNTQDIYHQIVLFDPAKAQELSDKAVTVIRMAEAGELPPRITDRRESFACRFCSYQDICWNQ